MKVMVFDTETTDIINNRTIPLDRLPSIVEFYGCIADLESGEIIAECEHLIKPPRPMTEDNIRIHHITNEMVADKPPFAGVAADIKSFIENSPRPLAHNASFDIDMVEVEFERLGQTVKWGGRPICTVEKTIHLKGFRLKLSELYQMLFNEMFVDAHRAKNDVMALVKCASKLHEMDEI